MWVQRDHAHSKVSNELSSTDGGEIAPEEMPELFKRVLRARGLVGPDQDLFFNQKLSGLKDPFSIDQLEEAAGVLLDALVRGDLVCLYADFDLDGSSGLALVRTCLENFGFSNFMHYQPRRLKEGYGFHDHVVDELADLGVKLIVTIDVGITAISAHKRANERGVQVLLTDHHLPADSLPNARCVVNPNKGTCKSGLTYLSGAGVAFYLMLGLRRVLCKRAETDPSLTIYANKVKAWDIKEVLDVFTIATLTDMVPLVGDNRVLVKHGLLSLQNTKRVALKKLMEDLGFSGRKLTASDVAIRIAPKLNALSRMDLDLLPIHIFIEKDPSKAKNLVKTMLGSNQDRLDLQLHAEKIAEGLTPAFETKDFIFIFSEEFHRGVIGLVATKLSQQFHKPCFVGSLGSDQMVVGSARQPDSVAAGLVEALEVGADLLSRFGGHHQAAGFEIHTKHIASLIARMEIFYAEIKNRNRVPITYFDTTAFISEISDHYFEWYQRLGPFGVGFPEPSFCFQALLVESVRELKGGHMKLVVRQTRTELNSETIEKNKNGQIEALYFSPPIEVKEWLKPGVCVDVIGEPQQNVFLSRITNQILVRKAKIADAAY